MSAFPRRPIVWGQAQRVSANLKLHGSNCPQSTNSSYEFGAISKTSQAEKLSGIEVSQEKKQACSGDTATSPMMRQPPEGEDSTFQRWGRRGSEEKLTCQEQSEVGGPWSQMLTAEQGGGKESQLRMANFRRTNYLLGDGLKDDACLLDSPDS